MTSLGRPGLPVRSGSRKTSRMAPFQAEYPSVAHRIGCNGTADSFTFSTTWVISKLFLSGETAPQIRSREKTLMAVASQTVPY